MPERKSADSPVKTLNLFGRFISRTMGLHFSRERLPELGRKMAAAAGEFGFDDPEACMLWLMSSPLSREHMEILAGALTIGETYFFRDSGSYRTLEKHVLPELIRASKAGEKRLRIWSAGCSSGEEPYSIAILLSRLIPDLSEWNLMLLATDINPVAMEKGRQGIFGRWSFRNAPPWLSGYFINRDDGRFEIIPEIRRMVQFSYLNLAEDTYPSLFNNTNALDVIFCRNVMLYFGPEMIERVTGKFRHALCDGGWLFVGPVEAARRSFDGFARKCFTEAHVYRKELGGGDVFSAQAAASPLRFTIPAGSVQVGKDVRSAVQAEGFSSPPQSRPATGAPSDGSGGKGTGAPGPAHVRGEARALYEKGEYGAAICKMRQLPDSGDAPEDAVELLAKSYANLGMFAEARECCEAAIAADRLRAANYYLLAMILQEEGRPEEAAAELNRALYVDHDYIPAYFALGNLNLQAGRQRESRRNFTNALRLLDKLGPDDTLPEADGLTAGRLGEIIRTMMPWEDRK